MEQPHYEYAYVNISDDFYLEPMMEKLGALFDICLRCSQIEGKRFVDAFIASGLAWQFEHHNPKYVAGMSGEELALVLGERSGLELVLPNEPIAGFTPQYWLGEMLAYFQTRTAWPYHRIFAYASCERLEGLYLRHGEDGPEEFCKFLKGFFAELPYQSNLKSLRKQAGFTQQELAQRAGVPLRTLQQYEQGSKLLGKASADTVHRLSLVLGCTMEELL